MGADIFGKLHEECGVFGIYMREEGADVLGITHHALYALQHRGQESCGIAVNDDGVITGHADTGLVSEVFTEDPLRKLPQGRIALPARCPSSRCRPWSWARLQRG